MGVSNVGRFGPVVYSKPIKSINLDGCENSPNNLPNSDHRESAVERLPLIPSPVYDKNFKCCFALEAMKGSYGPKILEGHFNEALKNGEDKRISRMREFPSSTIEEAVGPMQSGSPISLTRCHSKTNCYSKSIQKNLDRMWILQLVPCWLNRVYQFGEIVRIKEIILALKPLALPLAITSWTYMALATILLSVRLFLVHRHLRNLGELSTKLKDDSPNASVDRSYLEYYTAQVKKRRWRAGFDLLFVPLTTAINIWRYYKKTDLHVDRYEQAKKILQAGLTGDSQTLDLIKKSSDSKTVAHYEEFLRLLEEAKKEENKEDHDLFLDAFKAGTQAFKHLAHSLKSN